jgi:tetratricopeptide (TPR) repeat protein
MRLIVIVVVLVSFQIGYSQEKQEIKPPAESTPTDQNKDNTKLQETDLIEANKAIPSELASKEESQKTLDRSIGLLNIVAASMAVLVGLITLVFLIGATFGLFEYKRWKEVRARIEKDAKSIGELRSNLEKQVEAIRKEIEKTVPINLTEKPSGELAEKLDELSRKMEMLEAFGFPLRFQDYLNRARDLFYKEKYGLSLEAIDKAIEINSKIAPVWSNRGVTLRKLNRFEEALKAYEKAIELDPTFAMAWMNITTLFLELKRYKDGLNKIERAIKRWPDDPELWSQKGVALNGLKRHKEAIEAVDRAIELKPDFAGAFYNKACSFSLLNNKNQALIFLSKAIELDKGLKKQATSDEDFRNLWEDEDFKKIVQ